MLEETETEPGVRFVVDSMLGSLARWLRILGYDTLYAKDWHDTQILETASKENRIIVTRDRGLYNRARRKKLRAVYVTSDVVKSLAILAQSIGLRLHVEPNRSRCPLCNATLREANKDEVKGRVPPRVLELYDKFWVCTGCGQVYWIGGHWRGIMQTLEEAVRLVQRRRRQNISSKDLRRSAIEGLNT